MKHKELNDLEAQCTNLSKNANSGYKVIPSLPYQRKNEMSLTEGGSIVYFVYHKTMHEIAYPNIKNVNAYIKKSKDEMKKSNRQFPDEIYSVPQPRSNKTVEIEETLPF